ncbi:MAG: DUF192 domain-containing protein [Nanoarchaeota archaeon]
MKPYILLLTFSGTIFLGLIFIFSNVYKNDSTNNLAVSSSIGLPANLLNLPDSLYLNNKKISLIISNTPSIREKGLSGMASLPDDSAMLFVFERLDKHGFWMKDMNFPIDIIWLDDKYIITHIESNISPDTFPKVFHPEKNSLYVLEANAYFAQENNMEVGDKLNFR